MEESPTASGEAEATTISEMSSARHRARAPTNRSEFTATSTRAQSRSGSPSMVTYRIFSRRNASSPTRPVATSPVASPATVASCILGKVLLVPVESVQRGCWDRSGGRRRGWSRRRPARRWRRRPARTSCRRRTPCRAGRAGSSSPPARVRASPACARWRRWRAGCGPARRRAPRRRASSERARRQPPRAPPSAGRPCCPSRRCRRPKLPPPGA